MTDAPRPLDDLIHAGNVAMVTTATREGSLTARPFTVAEVDGNLVLFLVDRTAGWVDDLAADTKVNGTVVSGSRNSWVSMTGTATLSTDASTIERLWSAPAGAYFDGKDDPRIAALQLTVDEGEYWQTVGFGPIGRIIAVVSAALGKPDAMSSHGDIDATK